jgi:phosphatidylinositol glycan class H protein
MSSTYPLPCHPEFSVINYSGYREYRVENRKLVITSKSRKWSSYIFSCFVVGSLSIGYRIFAAKYYYPVLVASLLVVLNSTLFQVLHESVILLPPHGIQLETHRGPFSSHPIFSIKHYIPASKLSGVVINEGLRGWNVLFYLVAMWHTESRGTVLKVAYQDLLPVHPILLQVLEGIHELILCSPVHIKEDVP